MAGSEKTGYANSKRILIENAYYMITPTGKNPDACRRPLPQLCCKLKSTSAGC